MSCRVRLGVGHYGISVGVSIGLSVIKQIALGKPVIRQTHIADKPTLGKPLKSKCPLVKNL